MENTNMKRFSEIASLKRRIESNNLDTIESELNEFLNELIQNNQYCTAGIIAEQGTSVFWGDGTDRSTQYANHALNLYHASLYHGESDIKSLVSYKKTASIYRSYTQLSNQASELSNLYQYNERKYSELLETLSETTSHKESFLLNGFYLITDLDKEWTIKEVSYELDDGSMSWGETVRFSFPGAVNGYINILDYEKAKSILDKFDVSHYPKLQGWKYVCEALIETRDNASILYRKASESFFKDSQEESKRLNKGHWSGFSQQCLSPYYSAKSILLSSETSAEDKLEKLKQVSKLIDPDKGGWLYGPSKRLGLLAKRLGQFIETADESIMEKLLHEYSKELSRGTDIDQNEQELKKGLELLVEGLKGFKSDPLEEITKGRISNAFTLLEKHPLHSSALPILEMKKDISKSALMLSQGTKKDEVLNLLKQFKNEVQLQKFVFRLLIAENAKHVKIAHGPVEYGKDIVACIENKDKKIELHLYALKAGDINASSWKDLKDQIDEMNTIETKDATAGKLSPEIKVVHVLFNGQIKQQTEEKVINWLKHIEESNGWKTDVINIVRLADWVIERHMTKELESFINKQ